MEHPNGQSANSPTEPSPPGTAPAPAAESTEPHRQSQPNITQAVVSLIIVAGGALAGGLKVASDASPGAAAWITAHIPWFVVGFAAFAVLLAGASMVPIFRTVLGRLSEAAKSTLIVFVLIPVTILAVLSVPFLPEPIRVSVVHIVFVLVLCLLPGVMFYLFIVSRRPSMLNEYVASLMRLGLIGWRSDDPDEPTAFRRRRVESYIQRFEAVYGPIRDGRDELIDELARTHDLKQARSAGSLAYGEDRPADLGQVFPRDVLVQLFLTTILLAVGWLLVLPPAMQPGSHPATVSIANQQVTGRASGAASPALEPASSDAGPSAGDVGNATLSSATSFPLIPTLSPVNMAFVGAYFFCLQMVFRRFVRRDLTVKVYVNTCVRVVLAVLAAWMMAVVWSAFQQGADPYTVLTAGFRTAAPLDSPVLIAAFALGVFPNTLWQLITAGIKKFPGVSWALPSLESGQQLSELDGMTVWHESRLQEEDVENIANMATTDVLDLMLQTRFPPERLMRWIDQAILLTSVGVPPAGAASEGGLASALEKLAIHTATDLYICCSPNSSDMEARLGTEFWPAVLNILVQLRLRSSNFSLVSAWFRVDGFAAVSSATAPAGGVPATTPQSQSPISTRARQVAAA